MKKTLLLSLVTLCALPLAAQDDCASALPVGLGITTVDSLDGTDIPAVFCSNTGSANRAEWFSFTATMDTTVRVSTDLAQNGGGDTRFHVYSGTCGNLTCVAGDDDDGSGYLSVDTFSVTMGATYLIVFDDRWSADGFDFQISYSAPPPPPPLGAVGFTTQNLATSSPMAVVDMDGDRLDDLVVPGTNFIVIYHQQAGGGFLQTTIPTTPADNSASWSLAAGDIDGNGYNDLLYGGGSGVTFMMAGPGGTSFTEVSFPQYVFSQRSNMIDINNDGHLDAFVCHDVDANVFFMNDGFGNLSFNQGGFGQTCGNYGSIFTDYDNDGDMDCFVAKCGCDPVDLLLRNDGNGVFTSVAAGTPFNDNHQSWSSAWGDFDNDGDMDVLVGSSSSSVHKLMLNTNGVFTNVTTGSGFDMLNGQSIEWTTHDFNNDGFLDVMGGGALMLGNGDMTFQQQPGNYSNGPVGDLNNDGFLDYMNSGNGRINNGNSNHWIKINTVGTISNRNGIGARVEITSALGTQIRDVKSGDGFRYMSSLNTHFGIGTDTSIDQVTVYWPSGIVQTVYSPAIDDLLEIVEGTSTGLDDMVFTPGFSLFPNPAREVLTLSAANDLSGSAYTVFDISGKQVMQGNVQHSRLDISALQSGVYMITVRPGNGNALQQRFVKE